MTLGRSLATPVYYCSIKLPFKAEPALSELHTIPGHKAFSRAAIGPLAIVLVLSSLAPRHQSCGLLWVLQDWFFVFCISLLRRLKIKEHSWLKNLFQLVTVPASPGLELKTPAAETNKQKLGSEGRGQNDLPAFPEFL